MGKDVTPDHMLDSLRLAVKDIIDKQKEPMVLMPRIQLDHPGPEDMRTAQWDSSANQRKVLRGRPHKNYLIEE